ncbi:hypothetical protein DL765_000087 [Monosporascus sp. GIB2]|nr:hypothetical protein DL765_000087 [Monosporascus sp. GIB2]
MLRRPVLAGHRRHQDQRAGEIAEDGAVQTHAGHGRTIEIFRVRGRGVAKATFEDADIYGKTGKAYGDLPISGERERRTAREIGGGSEDYWKKARDLAQQQLYLDDALEAGAREALESDLLHVDDPNLSKMLDIVRERIPKTAFNPYHQARRDGFAVSHDLFRHVRVDIVMALDDAGAVIAFVFSDAFRALPTKGGEKEVVRSLETYSTLQPVPVPDMTRHGLRWVDCVLPRPDLDFRNPQNDPRLTKFSVYHFGDRCGIGDPDGRVGPGPSQDLQLRGEDNPTYDFQQLVKSKSCALGACTELVRFFLNLLDPDLLAKYVEVSKEISKSTIPFEARRTNEPFVMRAVLVNLMIYEQWDGGAWHCGLAGLVPVGQFEAGDLVMYELGLRAAPAGPELRHSTTRWTGRRRFVVAGATYEAVRRWPRCLRKTGDGRAAMTTTTSSGTPSPFNSCIDAKLEDIPPEDSEDEGERVRIPDCHLEESDSVEASGGSRGSDEARRPPLLL